MTRISADLSIFAADTVSGRLKPYYLPSVCPESLGASTNRRMLLDGLLLLPRPMLVINVCRRELLSKESVHRPMAEAVARGI